MNWDQGWLILGNLSLAAVSIVAIGLLIFAVCFVVGMVRSGDSYEDSPWQLARNGFPVVLGWTIGIVGVCGAVVVIGAML